jgi:hypothetical protein
MKRWIPILILVSILFTAVVAAAKGPEINFVDNRLSVNAETVSLGRLLQLVGLATGMTSKVPPELANRPISVRFSGLNMADGVRKIFQGQPLDYVVVEGQSIVVTAAAQTQSAGDTPPAYNQPNVQSFDQPFFQEPQQGYQQQLQQQGQPAMVQTPFGPIANPRALQQQNTAVNPVQQQNSLFPQVGAPGQGQPQQQGFPPLPGMQTPGNQMPFGAPSAFGTATPQQNPNNSLFGAPSILVPGSQQQR